MVQVSYRGHIFPVGEDTNVDTVIQAVALAYGELDAGFSTVTDKEGNITIFPDKTGRRVTVQRSRYITGYRFEDEEGNIAFDVNDLIRANGDGTFIIPSKSDLDILLRRLTHYEFTGFVGGVAVATARKRGV